MKYFTILSPECSPRIKAYSTCTEMSIRFHVQLMALWGGVQGPGHNRTVLHKAGVKTGIQHPREYLQLWNFLLGRIYLLQMTGVTAFTFLGLLEEDEKDHGTIMRKWRGSSLVTWVMEAGLGRWRLSAFIIIKRRVGFIFSFRKAIGNRQGTFPLQRFSERFFKAVCSVHMSKSETKVKGKE